MESEIHDKSGPLLVSTFYLGNTLLGIDSLSVQEIIKMTDITRVHHAPDYVPGVINLRGKIVTVIDLRKKLGFPETDASDESRIIIVESDDEYIGLLVDAISDVIAADKDDLMPPPPNLDGEQERFFEGVYKADQGRIIGILSNEQVLSTENV